MTEVILDTNYVVALLDAKDVWHTKAATIQDKLVETEAAVVYLDCVMDEVISVLARRHAERGRAHEFSGVLNRIETLVPPERITWIYPIVKQLYAKVLPLVRKSRGELNFHDALIVAASDEMGVAAIVSFDADFDKTKMERIHGVDSIAKTLG